jgi:enoyl-CoA hydratase/carnithine racemase
VRELAEAVADKAPLTLRATKEAIRRIGVARRADHPDLDDLVASCYASGDFREGVAAFIGRRAARFMGR